MKLWENKKKYLAATTNFGLPPPIALLLDPPLMRID
jgi:hypothetical protein